ncbi:MAG: xanthine dehydrogenase family protein subunit M [bacterium]|nr:xanthine dehydrogenase family protein subunit M [bacterium]
MKSFRMVLPTSVEEASRLLPTAEGGASAKLLAGGQDLLTELKEHLVEPDTLVNLKSVPGLDTIEWNEAGELTIGALVTLTDLEEEAGVVEKLPILSEAAASIASAQIRSVGTVGGNLNQRPRCWYYRAEHAPCLKKGGSECYAFEGRNKYNAILGGGPSYIVHPSDLAPALVALGAKVTLKSHSTSRQLLLEDFYTLPSDGDILTETRLKPDEVLTHVHIPKQRAGMRSTYLKFKERASYDFALSSVALCLWLDQGQITRTRIVLGGVAPKPWRTVKGEQAILGKRVDARTIEMAREACLDGAVTLSENGFKIPLTKGLLTRAFQKLA